MNKMSAKRRFYWAPLREDEIEEFARDIGSFIQKCHNISFYEIEEEYEELRKLSLLINHYNKLKISYAENSDKESTDEEIFNGCYHIDRPKYSPDNKSGPPKFIDEYGEVSESIRDYRNPFDGNQSTKDPQVDSAKDTPSNNVPERISLTAQPDHELSIGKTRAETTSQLPDRQSGSSYREAETNSRLPFRRGRSQFRRSQYGDMNHDELDYDSYEAPRWYNNQSWQNRNWSPPPTPVTDERYGDNLWKIIEDLKSNKSSDILFEDSEICVNPQTVKLSDDFALLAI